MAVFYLDEDVPEAIAPLLVGFGHRATTTRAEGRKGIPDYAQLWHSAIHNWIFVTLNRKDYLLLHGAWQHWDVSRQHGGILMLPHVPRANLPTLAAAIDTLVSNPSTILGNAVYGWTASAGWR
ncbi:MAG TPA: DUF5615 family PIN-like protein [Chloroflexota bacterium]|nr:DUF5615 family PIN-like protein [Chloroflexota bacterium]